MIGQFEKVPAIFLSSRLLNFDCDAASDLTGEDLRGQFRQLR